MTRKGKRFLAATALTLSLAGAAFAEQHESEGDDCPEDMNTSAGCQMEGAEESERQPVEGAATAPVAETDDAGEDTTTMTGPDTEGEGDQPETDATGSDENASDMDDSAMSEEDCPEDDDTEPGCDIEGAEESDRQPVEGAATAPVPEGGEGETTMEDPEADPESDVTTDDGSADSDASADDGAAGDTSGADDGEASDENVDAAPQADDSDPNIAVAYEDGGRYYTDDDVPTYNIAEDGTVDWLTFSGFRRYHAECHVCHGPDGEGSTYAPAIKNSAVNMDYYDFYDVVVNGRQNGNSVMPHFGDNPNVMCYLDDIYVYLKARGMEAVPRGRPSDKEAKAEMIQEAENACMG